jgi:hypothetical protein
MKKQLGTLEERNSTNEKRTFCRSVLQIKHGYQHACRDKQVKIITGEEEVTNKWAERFEELLKENDKEGRKYPNQDRTPLTVQPWTEGRR